jgi:hypothetical protein
MDYSTRVAQLRKSKIGWGGSDEQVPLEENWIILDGMLKLGSLIFPEKQPILSLSRAGDIVIEWDIAEEWILRQDGNNVEVCKDPLKNEVYETFSYAQWISNIAGTLREKFNGEFNLVAYIEKKNTA